MRLSRLFKRTFLSLLVLFGVIATATSFLSAWTLYTSLREESINKGKAVAQSIATASAEVVLTRDASTVQSLVDQYLKTIGSGYVIVIDSNHVPVSHTFIPAIPEGINHLPQPEDGFVVSDVSLEGVGEYIDIAAPILAGVAGHVHVGLDKKAIDARTISAIVRQQMLLAIICVLSIVIFYMLVGRISQPLNKLTEYAERLADHDFKATIDIESKDEIGLLASTMQDMAGELSHLVSGLERSVENATAELQDTLTYTRAIIENMADGVLVTDKDGRISHFNPALLSLFNFSTDANLRDKDVRQMFPRGVAALVSRSVRDDHPSDSAEIALAGARVGQAVASPIHGANWEGGMECIGVVILVRDVTSEKEVDRMKTEFISTVSHELRTPLTSILGFAKIIRKKLDDTLIPLLDAPDGKTDKAINQVQDNIGIIISEGARLTDLINDVLDISKMESGKVEWRMRSTAISELIDHCVAGTQSLFMGDDLKCIVKVEDDLPEIPMDRDRIIQVLINLISNAVKFTEQGAVTIKAYQEGNFIKVRLTDTGCGIGKEELSSVFERFKQVGDTLTDKPKGTGLGLPICKHIVEMHGGEIVAQSVLGKGSVFEFSLPLSQNVTDSLAVKDEFAEEPSAGQSGFSDASKPERMSRGMATGQIPLILVVDDEESVREMLMQTLSEEGFRVEGAKDAYEALEKAPVLQPDLITMDLMMPKLDGATAIAKLRMDADTAHIPVLVITALQVNDTPGAEASLTKPIDENLLVETIHGVLNGDRVVARPCMVLTDNGFVDESGMLMICPENISYCSPGDIWRVLEEGFEGTIFIPAALSNELDLERLANTCKVQLIIMPEKVMPEKRRAEGPTVEEESTKGI